MNKINLADYPNIKAGENVTLECEQISCVGNVTLGDNVSISAQKISFGNNVKIESNTVIRSLRGDMELFSMGDESLLANDIRVLAPYVTLGDYTQVFSFSLLSGYKPLIIGHNCWVGQGAILNSAETLTLGNNVRMGGSQIWTHVASGELLEGSNFFGEQPVTLEDNVWLMGFGHMITPGVTLGRNSVIMAGSVVTKSTEPFHTYSGVPAKDITEKVPAWKDLTHDDKFAMLQKFIAEFTDTYPQYQQYVYCYNIYDDINEQTEIKNESLIFFKQVDLRSAMNMEQSVYDLSSKSYIKRRTPIEVAWMRFINGYRARFIPFNA